MNQRLQEKLLQSSDCAIVGRFTYGLPLFLRFMSSVPVEIGAFCSIADEVTFIMGGNHYKERVTTYPLNLLFDGDQLPWHETSKGRIVVGNDVWIGYGATILSGVTIGDGASIGAMSVVTRDIPAYSVAVGNPARIVGKRFSDEKIEMLLEMKWWDKDLEEIKSLAPVLLSDAYPI